MRRYQGLSVIGLAAFALAYPRAQAPRPIANRQFANRQFVNRSFANRQSAIANRQSAIVSVDPALFKGMKYRLVGPSRGGRVTTVTRVPSQPRTFYMGVASGGPFP